MSYARFGGGCDVYVFEHCLGWWQIFVTGGGDFRCGSPGECADRLEELRAEGRSVPQYAIDALRAEQAETDAQDPPR
jgi:hypothetical protein